MHPDLYAYLHSYYQSAANDYALHIDPVLNSLAHLLVEKVNIQAACQLLDLGCGTGLVARQFRSPEQVIISLDFSCNMVKSAKSLGVNRLLCADMHQLPFERASFDLVLASLAFNSSNPEISIGEASRVLRPGGMLALLEWGSTDELSALFGQTLSDYATEEPSDILQRLRDARYIDHPWDRLETAGDIVTLLHKSGFPDTELVVTTHDIELPSVDSFIQYKLAWPYRRQEFEEMDAELRPVFLADIRENTSAYTNSSGTLTWSPNLVRIYAIKEA